LPNTRHGLSSRFSTGRARARPSTCRHVPSRTAADPATRSPNAPRDVRKVGLVIGTQMRGPSRSSRRDVPCYCGPSCRSTAREPEGAAALGRRPEAPLELTDQVRQFSHALAERGVLGAELATSTARSMSRVCRQRATRQHGEQTRCRWRPVTGCPQTAQRPASGGVRTSPDATLGSGLRGETLTEGHGRWWASAASTRALTHQAGPDAHRPHDRGSLCAAFHGDARGGCG
jgi:hypothetical protein